MNKWNTKEPLGIFPQKWNKIESGKRKKQTKPREQTVNYSKHLLEFICASINTTLT